MNWLFVVAAAVLVYVHYSASKTAFDGNKKAEYWGAVHCTTSEVVGSVGGNYVLVVVS